MLRRYGIWWPYEAELRFWRGLAPLCEGVVAVPRVLSIEADVHRRKVSAPGVVLGRMSVD